MEPIDKARSMAVWLEEKSLTGIEILNVAQASAEMEYFVIATAANERVAQTAVEHLEAMCAENGVPVKSKEGRSGSKWILIDAFDVVVHVFDELERRRYSLDKLWTGAMQPVPEGGGDGTD